MYTVYRQGKEMSKNSGDVIWERLECSRDVKEMSKKSGDVIWAFSNARGMFCYRDVYSSIPNKRTYTPYCFQGKIQPIRSYWGLYICFNLKKLLVFGPKSMI